VVILKEAFHFYDFIGSALILIGVWGTNRFK
jgi:drug/metabolite transporter (DMT)-like permease